MQRFPYIPDGQALFRPKYRETSSRFSLFCFAINAYEIEPVCLGFRFQVDLLLRNTEPIFCEKKNRFSKALTSTAMPDKPATEKKKRKRNLALLV